MNPVKTLSILLVVAIAGCTSSPEKIAENRLAAHDRDSVELSFTYLPASKYLVNTEADTDMVMSIDGAIENLPEGFNSQMPVGMKSREVAEYGVVTGQKEDGKSYPLTMTILANDTYRSINGSEMQKIPGAASDLVGLIMKGEVQPDGTMKLLAIEGRKLPKEFEAIVASMFSQLNGAMSEFNGKTLRIGESVSQTIPMQIPIADGAAIGFEIETIYNLVSITRDQANFDLDYGFTLSAEFDAMNIKLDGSGDGKMVYDFKRRFSPEMSADMKMEARIPLPGGEFVSAVNSRAVSNTSIVQ